MLKFLISISVAIACVVGVIGTAIGIFFLTTPRPTNLRGCLTTEMYKVRLCPTEPGYVRLREISTHARNAVIVSEDAAFYTHNGFDWDEIKNSIETNLEKGTFARGGSTITQQLAKNVYLNADKSLLRKAREALIVTRIEKLLKKDEILGKYLNVVEFGPNLFGIGKASRHYFGKHPSQLTPAEGAFLAFLLPNPKTYSVSFRKKRLTPFARKQMREIVGRLYRFKRIPEDQYQTALVHIDHFFGAAPLAPLADGEGLEPSAEELGEMEEGLEADFNQRHDPPSRAGTAPPPIEEPEASEPETFEPPAPEPSEEIDSTEASAGLIEE